MGACAYLHHMNQYQLTITPSELSIKPFFGYKNKIRLFVFLAVLIFGSMPFLTDVVDYNIRYVSYGIGGIMLFYAVYDFLFHVNVMFLFDKKTNSIYKINAPFFKKRLMAFDEMTIINTSECGAMQYAIGKKRNQFLKNYIISDTFTNSKKSQERETEYVEKVLDPILDFIKNE